MDIPPLIEKLRVFAAERDWEQYHTPKNLAMALSVEASELVEIFQWLNEKEASEIMQDAQKREAVEDELADILLYLLRTSDVLGVNLQEAAEAKLLKNTKKYPVSVD